MVVQRPPTNHNEVQRKAWLDVGYLAFPGPKETVTFRRRGERGMRRPPAWREPLTAVG